MPNYCFADIKVRGYKDNVDEFTRILQADYDYNTMEFTHKPHFFRIFDAHIVDEKLEGVMKTTWYSIECAWSVSCCMCNGPFSYYDENKERFIKEYGAFYATNLQKCAQKLGLFIEIFSSEEGMEFNEYMLYNNQGMKLRDDCYNMNNYDLNDYASREDFMNKTGEYIDEYTYKYQMEECEGWYASNGYEPKWIVNKLVTPINVIVAKKVRD